LLYALCHDPASTPRDRLEEARRWAARFFDPLTAAAPPHENDRSPSRRLKVGYVSPDFRQHTIARLIAPILAHHDRALFDVFCYSAGTNTDTTTARLRGMCENWHDISRTTDADAAALIRDHCIDVLVDLAGHMDKNRLGLFARKPAPVQIQLGYAATTGLRAIDARVSDSHSDPPGAEVQYTERLLRMPACAWCYEPDPDAPDAGPSPALASDHVTFSCLNRPDKFSDAALDCWAEVIDRVPQSRLVLLAGPAGPSNSWLRERFLSRGISESRILLAPRLARHDYLRLMATTDIALDSFPYNGDTTTCDAFWMGVPVVTLAGDSFLSRRGISLLKAVGLDELICASPQEYVDCAVQLASDPMRLARIRRELRERMMRSPLCDGASYARELEREFRQAFRAWRV
jgi:predicted O-linked N-acetylglucosamine transferase (SPINDLY family)